MGRGSDAAFLFLALSWFLIDAWFPVPFKNMISQAGALQIKSALSTGREERGKRKEEREKRKEKVPRTVDKLFRRWLFAGKKDGTPMESRHHVRRAPQAEDV
ncbi:hypothetical protein [Treponema saccharophilum]|uniref:hypothetical protein n=1 Tax=Treponema saccharophilum TaxID=165 RepID=UPI0030C68DB6